MAYKSPNYKTLSGFDSSNYPDIAAADDKSFQAKRVLDGAQSLVENATLGTPEYKKYLADYKVAQNAFEATQKAYDAAQIAARTDFVNQQTQTKTKSSVSQVQNQLVASNNKLTLLQNQRTRASDLGQSTSAIDAQIKQETANHTKLNQQVNTPVTAPSIYSGTPPASPTPTTPGTPTPTTPGTSTPTTPGTPVSTPPAPPQFPGGQGPQALDALTLSQMGAKSGGVLPKTPPPGPAAMLGLPAGVGAYDFFKNLISSHGTTGQNLPSGTFQQMVDAPNTAVAMQILTKTPWYASEYNGMNALVASDPSINPLDPASLTIYKVAEAHYRTVAEQNGVPAKFTTTQAIADAMNNHIDLNAYADRVKYAAAMVNGNPETLAALTKFHGINKSGVMAYYLDPTLTADQLHDISTQATLGGLATKSGLDLSGAYSLDLAKSIGANDPYRLATVKTAVADAGAIAPGATNLAGLTGASLSADQIVQGTLDSGSSAGKQLTGLASQERARFSGSGSGTDALDNNIGGAF